VRGLAESTATRIEGHSYESETERAYAEIESALEYDGDEK
jgi:hypothetical protein